PRGCWSLRASPIPPTSWTTWSPTDGPGTNLVELPVQWILDDAPHFWFSADDWSKKISSPDEVRRIWETEFRGYQRLGGGFILTMHPQIIGRPSRLDMLEGFVRFVKERGDAWIAPCRDIAA